MIGNTVEMPAVSSPKTPCQVGISTLSILDMQGIRSKRISTPDYLETLFQRGLPDPITRMTVRSGRPEELQE